MSSSFTQRRMRYAKRTERGFRSKSEEKVADDLSARSVHAGYEDTKLTYTSHHKYTPDFTIPLNSGTAVRFLEVKGYWESEDRRKIVAVKEAHPDVDIRFVFDNPNTKLRRGSKTSYGDWCDKHGFFWCKGPTVPEEWLK